MKIIKTSVHKKRI
jgi:hypothetical protein